jgi:hypothetical protein
MSLTEWPRKIAYTIEEAMFASGLSRRSHSRDGEQPAPVRVRYGPAQNFAPGA